jgi:light-regulated signal transduction histidine kinase (bacteriophytochrome)
LYTVDLDGYLDIIQGKGWALMNINPQEMTGINIFDTDLLDSFSKENIKSVLEGDNKEWVSNIRNRTLRNTSRPIYSSNSDILGAVVFGFDITDIISKTEELQQFAYVASHDLQEPLRMITNFLELLLHWYGPGTNKPLDDTAYHFIDRAVQGSKRMKRLIEDLLKYSRVETKAKEKQWLDVNKIISEVLENLYVQIEEKNADIEVDNKLDKVKADKPQLQQVIQNLINNGLKFNENIPSIKISTTENDNYWIFSIEDNGIGIDLKYRNKILEPFKRLHTQSEYSGTGMGLAICKRIIDRHKGSIEIESQIGKGSCFTFSIMKDD